MTKKKRVATGYKLGSIKDPNNKDYGKSIPIPTDANGNLTEEEITEDNTSKILIESFQIKQKQAHLNILCTEAGSSESYEENYDSIAKEDFAELNTKKNTFSSTTFGTFAPAVIQISGGLWATEEPKNINPDLNKKLMSINMRINKEIKDQTKEKYLLLAKLEKQKRATENSEKRGDEKIKTAFRKAWNEKLKQKTKYSKASFAKKWIKDNGLKLSVNTVRLW